MPLIAKQNRALKFVIKYFCNYTKIACNRNSIPMRSDFLEQIEYMYTQINLSPCP